MMGKSFWFEWHYLCLKIKKWFTIDRVQCEGSTWRLFMDVFVFLFGGVDFLLLFLFTTIKVRCEVDVSVFKEWSGEILLGKDWTLAN
jgi:hypothetical protein